MQAIAYEGYFNNGRFYVSGKVVPIPEQKRVFITILDDAQEIDLDKQKAWDDFKHMLENADHENDLLTDDILSRNNICRDLIHFSDGVEN